MDILFKRACVDDAIKFIEIQNICFKADYIQYGECPAYNETQEAIVRQIENSIVYKILIDEKIIGDIIVRKQENDSYYLRVISVIPECQDFGIGMKAIEFIEKDNPNAKQWNLLTPLNNQRNNHFYKKMGYEKTGEIVHSDILTLCEYKKVMLLE